MDKKQLYSFSLKIRDLLNQQNTAEAERLLQQAELSKEEINFVEMCLRSQGYDPATGSFIHCESDNSEFLKLVNTVISKNTKKSR